MPSATQKKTSLKDKLDGNELDLSLSNLTTIPVRELVPLSKATHLDLSCNLLSSVPDDFCQLTHLVKLDLSRNQIQQLPRNMGRLAKLQYIDLSSNQLETLPVSFCQLKALKWLDVKDNPLHSSLKKASGDCLDEKQCKKAAEQVVQYMKLVQSEFDRQKQAELKEKREQQASKTAELKKRQQEEEEQRRKEKKVEKEKRRREYEEKIKQSEQVRDSKKAVEGDKADPTDKSVTKDSMRKERRSDGCLRFRNVLLATLVVLVAVVVGALVLCDRKQYEKHETCRAMKANVYPRVRSAMEAARPVAHRLGQALDSSLNTAREQLVVLQRWVQNTTKNWK